MCLDPFISPCEDLQKKISQRETKVLILKIVDTLNKKYPNVVLNKTKYRIVL